MGTVVSSPERNRTIATAASVTFYHAENPSPRSSYRFARIEDFLTVGEVEASKSADHPQPSNNRKDSEGELKEHVFEYNDTGEAWNKLEQHSNYNLSEPYIGRDGKTPCTHRIKRTTIIARNETEHKLVDAWMRAKTPRPPTAIPSTEIIPKLEDIEPQPEDGQPTCYLCSEGFSRLVKCRVCGRHIHTPKCIYQETSGDLVVTATSLRCFMTGFVWSCPTCENLLGLMSDEEMIELMEDFDALDFDCDSRISLDDYMKFKHKHHKTKYKKKMELSEIETAVEEFQRLDKAKCGHVDWWSFIDSNIIEKLSDRHKTDLVLCLTPCEVSEAKELFQSFDSDADGKISLREAEKTYERWFASLWSKVLNCPDTLTGPKKNPTLSKVVGEHVQVNVKIFMEADAQNQGTVSWLQFLKDQAIYILAARRNPSNLYKIPPKENELKIIREETSYSE